MNMGFAGGGTPGPGPPTFAQYYFPPYAGGSGGAERKPLSAHAEGLMSTSVLIRTLFERGRITKEKHDRLIDRIRKQMRGLH
jgi:hypothetical protein